MLIRLGLIANLLFVLAMAGVAGLVGLVGGGGSGIPIVLGICLLIAISVTIMTIRCVIVFDRRRAAAIVALSLPAYVPYLSSEASDSTERRLAKTFLTGDSAASATARAKLEATQRRTHRLAAPILVEGLRSTTDPAKRRAIIELLGTVTLYDSAVVDALVPLARKPIASTSDTLLRRVAFAALRRVNEYTVDVVGVHYVGLTDDGLAAFRLPRRIALYGDSVAVALSGLVLPRPNSANSCETAAAVRAKALLADTLAGATRVDLVDIGIGDDGEYFAEVRRDAFFLHELLKKDLPPVLGSDGSAVHAVADTLDWCKWRRRLQ